MLVSPPLSLSLPLSLDLFFSPRFPPRRILFRSKVNQRRREERKLLRIARQLLPPCVFMAATRNIHSASVVIPHRLSPHRFISGYSTRGLRLLAARIVETEQRERAGLHPFLSVEQRRCVIHPLAGIITAMHAGLRIPLEAREVSGVVKDFNGNFLSARNKKRSPPHGGNARGSILDITMRDD